VVRALHYLVATAWSNGFRTPAFSRWRFGFESQYGHYLGYAGAAGRE
jgi:hypothetical protein